MEELEDPNLKKGNGKFSFSNGDTYDGDYALHLNKGTLVKDGEGVYVTNDYNTYSGKWENDNFADDNFFIRHNNGTQYKGGIDVRGQMNGKGSYTFPDNSSIHAVWSENRPVSEIKYQDAFEYIWIVESISDDSIYFMPSNHFWTETCQEIFDDIPKQSSMSTLLLSISSNK